MSIPPTTPPVCSHVLTPRRSLLLISVTLSDSAAVLILGNFFIHIDDPSICLIFQFLNLFSSNDLSSTLPLPFSRSHIKSCICQSWNPCMISFSSFPYWLFIPLTFLVYFFQYFNYNNPLNQKGLIEYLSYFFFTTPLLMSSLPLLFNLKSVVNHYTNSLANAISVFPLPYYIGFAYLQSWLKSILCLLHACICLVDMTKEKHTTMLTGLTLCSWSLTLSGPLMLSSN